MLAVGRPATPPLPRPLQPTASFPDYRIHSPAVTSLPSASPSSSYSAAAAALPPLSRIHTSRPRPHPCRARRRMIRHGVDEDEGEEHGHNQDLSVIEFYSATARGEALLVRATVDAVEETVLVFKGFSSLLSSGTSSDPAKSVLPERAVITSVDVVRGPFDPSNIEYLERGLTWEAFKTRIQAGRLY